MKWIGVVVGTVGFVVLMGCHSVKPDEFETSKETVAPASRIDWLGQSTPLLGQNVLRVGERFPVATLINEHMKSETLPRTSATSDRGTKSGTGQVTVVSIVPSLDTEVCERQTHLLAESRVLHPGIERVTVSRDLPYAQSRFARESKLANVHYLSDYVNGEFGQKTGLEIEKNHLLARAVVVLDREGVVRYLQIVPKIYALPDMEAAFAAANKL